MAEKTLTQSSSWLSRFAWLTAATTLLLICSGGMVTSKGVGLAVPDWPTTFGYNMFLFPFSKWVGGILFEHTHRLLGAAVGLLTIVLAVWLSRIEHPGYLKMLGWIALAAVIVQGVLGGLRVTMLKDEIGIFHACLAQAFFGLLVFIALATTAVWRALSMSPANRERIRSTWKLSVVLIVAIYFQLALGATMRHQHRDLAIVDFPTANGQWIPVTSRDAIAKLNAWREARALSEVTPFQIWLQMVHRANAILVLAAAIALWRAIRKHARGISPLVPLSSMLIVAVAIQIALGAWTIWSNKAADIATAHVAVGATLLAFAIVISAIAWRLSHSAQHRQPSTPPLQSQSAVIA